MRVVYVSITAHCAGVLSLGLSAESKCTGLCCFVLSCSLRRHFAINRHCSHWVAEHKVLARSTDSNQYMCTCTTTARPWRPTTIVLYAKYNHCSRSSSRPDSASLLTAVSLNRVIKTLCSRCSLLLRGTSSTDVHCAQLASDFDLRFARLRRWSPPVTSTCRSALRCCCDCAVSLRLRVCVLCGA